ncbi:hypothetical protein RBB77_09965 [Tunturibacter psychrotolerans]|uniref:Uncharacterized protein n=1 Tax=Tunturiibacter psychrotolerans TaxID=3069686 RepID=A0AAU7ZW63_9BACT
MEDALAPVDHSVWFAELLILDKELRYQPMKTSVLHLKLAEALHETGSSLSAVNRGEASRRAGLRLFSVIYAP